MKINETKPNKFIGMTGPVKGYNVLMVGNNPKELAHFYINLIKFDKIKFFTEVSFDLKDSMGMIYKRRPNYILLDDKYPVKQIRNFIQGIRNNYKTQDIPVALLKSSNNHVLVDGIQDFFLKENFCAERLFHSIKNSRKIRRTQIILYKTYKKSRKHYQNISDRMRDFFDSIL